MQLLCNQNFNCLPCRWTPITTLNDGEFNGSAQTLMDAVHFYEVRFGLVLTPQEESDLVVFLSAL